ncbi:MAG: hypothetical protein KGH65_04985, partial [Candidatus Micrarchaeota archaeon]|nr:hypothetical protein [Candidatus Micrarchaeota archaeon]
MTTANSQPLPATGQSNAYWTNVTPHVRDLQSHTGRQHFLERMEAGTCTFTLDGRFGYFLNGTSAGNNSGYVIQPRLPMAVC